MYSVNADNGGIGNPVPAPAGPPTAPVDRYAVAVLDRFREMMVCVLSAGMIVGETEVPTAATEAVVTVKVAV